MWIKSLSPEMPGAIGAILMVPMMLLELVGVVAKCFALMVRLFANMISGHTLLAMLMMFILKALAVMLRDKAPHLLYVAPLCVLGSVLVSLMEMLVAGLQAYIFTFLTAMFLGIYVEPQH